MARPSERNRQVIRQWEILRLLEEQPSSAMQLVGAVGDASVTIRTIFRDLEGLQAAGFPLYAEQDDDGVARWRTLTKGLIPARRAA